MHSDEKVSNTLPVVVPAEMLTEKTDKHRSNVENMRNCECCDLMRCLCTISTYGFCGCWHDVRACAYHHSIINNVIPAGFAAAGAGSAAAAADEEGAAADAIVLDVGAVMVVTLVPAGKMDGSESSVDEGADRSVSVLSCACLTTAGAISVVDGAGKRGARRDAGAGAI